MTHPPTLDDDEFERWRRAKAAQAEPDDPEFAAWKASKQGHDYHAEFKSGALGKRMAAANARDLANIKDENAAEPGYLERVATHVLNTAQGIPGVEAIQAGAGALSKSMSQNLATPEGRAAALRAQGPEGYRESLNTLREQTGKIGGATNVAEKLMGGLATIPFAPGGLIKGGAAIGAADALLSAEPETLGERAFKTAASGAIGGATGGLLKAGGNLAQRTGVTDLVASGLRKAGVAAGEALGTTGAANRLLEARQSVLDRLAGSGRSAADQVLAHAKEVESTAGKLYDRARKDTRAIDAPEVKDILENPIVNHVYEWGKRVHAARGGEIPTVTETVTVPRPEAVVQKELAARAERQAQRAQQEAARLAPVEEAEPAKPVRARTPGGRLKAFSKATDEELAAEYKALQDANAVENTAPTSLEDRSGGGPQYVGKKKGAAWATGRQVQRKKSLAKIEAELQRRGIDPADAYWLAEGRGGSHEVADDIAGEITHEPPAGSAVDDSFDFGSNAPGHAPLIDVGPDVPLTENQEVTRELPNPEILSLTKRALGQIAKGFASSNAITREQAITALPLLDKLRGELHNASPAWREADAYYAKAMNWRDAYTKAFGAQAKPTAGGLDPKKLKTPEAIAAWVAKAKGTPVGPSRAAGVQAGASAKLAESVKNAPLQPTIGETLFGAGTPFQPSEAAAKLRRPAFGSDAEAADFGQLIGKLEAEGAKGVRTPGIPVNKWGLMRSAAAQLLHPNPLSTPRGVALRQELATALADPQRAAIIQAGMERAKRGQVQLTKAQKAELVMLDRLLKAGFRPEQVEAQ